MGNVPPNTRQNYPLLWILILFLGFLFLFSTNIRAAENQPPTANAASVTTPEDTKLAIKLTGKDPEKQPLTYAIITQPSHGKVVLKGNVATYTPTANYFSPTNTPDSFTFKVNDKLVDSAPATISITVQAVNDKPIAQNGEAYAVKNTARSITLSGTDIEGDKLTYVPAATTLQGGTVAVQTDSNTVTYTPKKNYIGADSFTFTIKDSQNATSDASTVSITVKGVNTPPIANAGADITSNKNTLTTLDGSGSLDRDGNIMSYAWVQTVGSTVALTNATTVKPTFTTPNVTANTTLTFELTVKDNNGAIKKDTVNVIVTPKIALSGTAFESPITGGTVTVKNLLGKILGTTTTNTDGTFTLNVLDSALKNGYIANVTGGKVNGTAFTDTLTATYSGTDSNTAVNLTAVTSLIDAIAADLTSATPLKKRDAAIQKLAKIGMVKADNWNLLASDYFDLSALALRIKDAGGVQAWLDVINTDIADGELSVAEMRSLFPKAHGGLESASVRTDISVFPGDKSSTTIAVEPMEKVGAVVVKLMDAPSWVKVVGNTVTAEPPTGEAPAVHTVNINISPDGVLAGRKTQLNISILKQVTLLHGFLGPEGGKIENAWRDMAISAPAGKLTQNYEITYFAGLNQNGEVITTLEKIPDMPNSESDYLNFLLPSTDVISNDYLAGANPTAVKNYANSDGLHMASQNQKTLNPGEAKCEELSRNDGDGDGFVFDEMLIGNNGDSLDVTGVTGNPRVLPSKSLAIKPKQKRNELGLKNTCQSALFTSGKVLDPLISDQIIGNYIVEPILFVHGFASGEVAEVDGYFYNFPELVHNLKIGNRRFASFNFVWNTNSRFEDAANDLGNAIKEINRRTKRKVHIVAHSFGGVLVRTLLQGLAEKMESFSSLDGGVTGMERNDEFKNTVMSNYIASVTTVGSPHSGIFPSTVSPKFDGRSPVTFYDGTHGFAGNVGIPFCQALTCHEVGMSYHKEYFDKIFTRSMSNYDSKKVFGVESAEGEIAFRLASHFDFSDVDSEFFYPLDIPTQVLIGTAPKSGITDTFSSNASCLSVDKGANCMMHYDLNPDSIGDELISLAGQRLIPQFHAEKKGVYNNGLIQEHMLGFHAFNLIINQDYLLDRIYEDEKFDSDNFHKLNNDAVFYNHRGGQYDYNYQTKVVDTNWIDKTVAKTQTPMLSEVALKNCDPKYPNNCEHATWRYVVNMLKKHPAGNVASVAQIKAKGSVGYAAPAAARTAGAAALAANETVEGFVVNIFLDGEQLGTTTSDANGAFDLDVEFKPKRTYVLEVYPPASMDAAVAPRAIVVKKTSGLTVEDTDFDFSRLELIKNAKAPQQGELGIQLKDDSTGNVLLGYNLSVANFSYTLVNAKPINADSDAIFTLPESLYAVTTTKPGYVGTGKSLCMVRQLASNPCVVTMLANDGDKDGDSLSNLEEYNLGTNPAKADTDGDGYTDKQEVEAGSDPLDKGKHPTLSAPQNLKATPGDGKVTLSWDSVIGASGYRICFAGYNMQDGNSSVSKMYSCFADGGWDNFSHWWSVIATTSVTLDSVPSGVSADFDTPKFKNGAAYRFIVMALDSNGVGYPNSMSAEITATPTKPVGATGKLNDTGITTCSDRSTNGLPCPVAGLPMQDAEFGRDANQATNNDTDGHAGFSFTKISSTGAELPASATEWSCVKDNVTGLMWEVKTDDGGLHDKDWGYSWYEPDNTKNGGSAGYPNNGSCGGTSQCDTYGFVQAVNATGWCGVQDWRMPSKEELRSIVSYDRLYPAIDTAYFPNTPSSVFWSASPNVYFGSSAWVVYFGYGNDVWDDKVNAFQVRLVRSGQ